MVDKSIKDGPLLQGKWFARIDSDTSIVYRLQVRNSLQAISIVYRLQVRNNMQETRLENTCGFKFSRHTRDKKERNLTSHNPQ